MRAFIIFLLLALLSACQNIPSKHAATLPAVDKLYRNYIDAALRLDAKTISELYAIDASYLTPEKENAILYGPPGALQDMSSFLAQAGKRNERIGFSFRVTSRITSSDIVCDTGYYRIDALTENAKRPVLFGKMVNVFRKQPDGQWRFHVDSYSEAPADSYATAKVIAEYRYDDAG